MRDIRDELKRSDIRGIMEFAKTLIKWSRSKVLKSQLDEADIRMKSASGDPVTKIDVVIEQEWKRKIRNRYPMHSIVGEETSSYLIDSDLTWVLDPIDGTDDFIRNSPLYGSIIAVLYNSEPIVGLIDHPKLNLCLHATYGSEAFANGVEIRSNDPARRNIGEAVILPAYDDFRKIEQCDEMIAAIGREIPNQRVYRNVYGHTMVAMGEFAAGLEVDAALWDLAATRLLIEQSKGKFVIFRDTGGDYDERRFGAIFGQPSMVDRLSLIVNQLI